MVEVGGSHTVELMEDTVKSIMEEEEEEEEVRTHTPLPVLSFPLLCRLLSW